MYINKWYVTESCNATLRKYVNSQMETSQRKTDANENLDCQQIKKAYIVVVPDP